MAAAAPRRSLAVCRRTVLLCASSSTPARGGRTATTQLAVLPLLPPLPPCRVHPPRAGWHSQGGLLGGPPRLPRHRSNTALAASPAAPRPWRRRLHAGCRPATALSALPPSGGPGSPSTVHAWACAEARWRRGLSSAPSSRSQRPIISATDACADSEAGLDLSPQRFARTEDTRQPRAGAGPEIQCPVSGVEPDVVDLAASAAAPATASWVPVRELSWRETLLVYRDLCKWRLSALVVLTSMVGYAMAPGTLSLFTMGAMTTGTALCVGSANTFNQWAEVPFDSQMKRTKMRALVKGRIDPLHAFAFGAASGAAGVAVLAAAVNPLTAVLGGANIFLYAGVYTPMKRMSISNTWFGSVVGAIPPVMGWTAATNEVAPSALLLGAVLYAWQFPHFNALSWNLRGDYSRAGYRMMSVTDPDLCRKVAVRYSALLLPICWAAVPLGLTHWSFLLSSTAANGYLLHRAVQFHGGADEKTARKLFFASIAHLPLLLALFLVHKRRAWAWAGPVQEGGTTESEAGVERAEPVSSQGEQ